MHHITQTQILIVTFLNHVTLHDLYLTQCHQMLRRVLRSIPHTIHAVSSALIQSDTAACALPGEVSGDR